jgi:flagellar biosynthesis protein FlhB
MTHQSTASIFKCVIQSQQIEKDYFEDVAKVLEIVTEIQNKQIKSQNLTFEKLDENKKTLSEIHSV